MTTIKKRIRSCDRVEHDEFTSYRKMSEVTGHSGPTCHRMTVRIIAKFVKAMADRPITDEEALVIAGTPEFQRSLQEQIRAIDERQRQEVLGSARK